MKKKSKKNHIFGKFVFAVLMIFVLTGLIVSGGLIYYASDIDASLDVGGLFSEQGLTSKLYFTNEAGAEVELPDQRLYGLENRIFVGLDTIPVHVRDAFVAIEEIGRAACRERV